MSAIVAYLLSIDWIVIVAYIAFLAGLYWLNGRLGYASHEPTKGDPS